MTSVSDKKTDEPICPFCLKPYSHYWDMITGTLVVDKVFVHLDTTDGDTGRICPLPGDPRIQHLCINTVDNVVEIIYPDDE